MSDPASPMPDAGATPPDTAAPAPADGANEPKVLLTVLDNGDGSFTLREGDGPGEPAEGAADAAQPTSTSYDSVGALLKGVLDCVKKAQEGGDGTDDANFTAGYDGGSNASPPKAPPTPPMA